MNDAYQSVRPEYFETTLKVNKEPLGSCDEPFSSPLKDDLTSDPNYQPNSPFSSEDGNFDEEELNVNRNERYFSSVNIVIMFKIYNISY